MHRPKRLLVLGTAAWGSASHKMVGRLLEAGGSGWDGIHHHPEEVGEGVTPPPWHSRRFKGERPIGATTG